MHAHLQLQSIKYVITVLKAFHQERQTFPCLVSAYIWTVPLTSMLPLPAKDSLLTFCAVTSPNPEIAFTALASLSQEQLESVSSQVCIATHRQRKAAPPSVLLIALVSIAPGFGSSRDASSSQ